MNLKQKYELSILGMQLNIQTDESEESVRKNAKKLEERVNDLIFENPRITKGQAMLFLCMDYLSENEKLKEALKEKEA